MAEPVASDEEIKQLVYDHGPVVVFVHANYLQDSKGVVPFEVCDSRDTNHAVQLVGWTESYWIIKNSWGEMGHYGGYFYIPMGVDCIGINRALATVYL